MGHRLNGRDAIQHIDDTIRRARHQVNDAEQAADDLVAQHTEIKQLQVKAYSALADFRLGLLQTAGVPERLLDAEKKALDLLSQHDAYVASLQDKLETSSAAIDALEEKRSQAAQTLDEALETYETRVEEIVETIEADPAYQALAERVEEFSAISERAHSKLDLAEKDRREKGLPYEQDPLFSYLWARKFRSPNYKASAFNRFLDNWVASLCNYDGARLNYARLTELPVRIAEHAAQQDKARDQAIKELETFEAKALAEGGANDLKRDADGKRAGLVQLDTDIARTEMDLQKLTSRLEQGREAEAGPAIRARQVLETALQSASFPDLRVLVSETLDVEDDKIVDHLVKLRAQEMDLDIARNDAIKRPTILRESLSALEDLRKRFKRANFDSSYALFSMADIDEVLSLVQRRSISGKKALKRLERRMRRSRPRTDPDFGGYDRRSTLGLPEILGDIAIEVAKEAQRQNRGYRSRKSSPWEGRPTERRFPSRKSSGGFKLPKGPSGGFKTGGGF